MAAKRILRMHFPLENSKGILFRTRKTLDLFSLDTSWDFFETNENEKLIMYWRIRLLCKNNFNFVDLVFETFPNWIIFNLSKLSDFYHFAKKSQGCYKEKGRKLTRNFGFAIISWTAMFTSTSNIVWLANAIVFCGTIMVCVARNSKTKSRKLVKMQFLRTAPKV